MKPKHRFSLLAVTAGVILSACGPCWPDSEPDCESFHQVVIRDAADREVREFRGRIVVEADGIDESFECGSDAAESSVTVTCGADGIHVRYFGEEAVRLSISTDDGRTATEEFTLEFAPYNEDGCSCPGGGTYSMNLSAS